MKVISESDKDLIVKFYTEDGVSMKNIALYFVQVGKTIDESYISKILKKKGLTRRKGVNRNFAAVPTIESVYAKALRLMSSNLQCR